MNLKNKILKALGVRETNWYKSYGTYAPFCPYCNEPAYGERKCVFCGRRYIRGVKPQPEINVATGDYTASQTHDGTVYIFRGDRMVFEMPRSEALTEDELKGFIDELLDLGWIDD